MTLYPVLHHHTTHTGRVRCCAAPLFYIARLFYPGDTPHAEDIFLRDGTQPQKGGKLSIGRCPSCGRSMRYQAVTANDEGRVKVATRWIKKWRQPRRANRRRHRRGHR